MSIAEHASIETWSAGGHPDADALALVRDAIDAWLARPGSPSPTSSLTGGGAIAAFEREFGAAIGRPALLLPSATYGLRLALEVLEVGPGDEVLLPVLDWPSSYAAVRSLGAVPVPVPVDERTLTIDPAAAGRAVTPRTVAAIACHLHGVPADVLALRAATGLPVVEDCAAALGSTLDGDPVGSLGDVAVFSLGPGKRLSAGEGGVLATADPQLRERVLTRSAHPLRLLVSGIDPAGQPPDAFGMRVHPLTGVVGLHLLRSWQPDAEREQRHAAACRLAASGLAVAGLDDRRRVASEQVAVLLDQQGARSPGGRSGAHVLPCLLQPELEQRTGDLAARIRLLDIVC